MTKETLLYKLTGTETPIFLTEREQKIVDTCLQLINETEQLNKPVVMGRSELLLAFARHVMPDNFTDKALNNIVAQFLEGKQ